MEQMKELIRMLVEAGLPFVFYPHATDYSQVVLLDHKGIRLDDVIWSKYFSNGASLGLLETSRAGNYQGYETAEDVLSAWIGLYQEDKYNDEKE